MWALPSISSVPASGARVAHCYRCIYTWRPRSERVRICPRCKSRLWDVPRLRKSGPARPGLGYRELVAPYSAAVHRLARRYGVVNLRVFGSVARGEANRASDVDLLFDSEEPLGLLRREEFRTKLEAILGRQVDLVREEYLKWYVRPRALAEAVAV